MHNVPACVRQAHDIVITSAPGGQDERCIICERWYTNKTIQRKDYNYLCKNLQKFEADGSENIGTLTIYDIVA